MLRGIRPDLRPVTQVEGQSVERVEAVLVIEVLDERSGQLARRMRELHPDTALVLIAPSFDERAISTAAAVCAAAIVPSPCEPLALVGVLETLHGKGRFAGRCTGVDTSELLRLHAFANSTGVLHLAGPGRSGAIHLEAGRPVHAHCGERRGAEALLELLDWTDVAATWIEGRSGSTVTILGQVEGLRGHQGDAVVDYEVMQEAPREVLERVDFIADIEDILGAYLLRNSEVVYGRNDPSLDQALIRRSLTGLARVFVDMEDLQGEHAGSEIQAMVGEFRLVVDRIGPARLGFQIGVVVRQAAPITKSLRRLLRQLDRNFRRMLAERARAPIGPRQASAHARASLNRVA